MVKIFLKRYWPRSMSNRTQLHGTFIFSYRQIAFARLFPRFIGRNQIFLTMKRRCSTWFPLGSRKITTLERKVPPCFIWYQLSERKKRTKAKEK